MSEKLKMKKARNKKLTVFYSIWAILTAHFTRGGGANVPPIPNSYTWDHWNAKFGR